MKISRKKKKVFKRLARVHFFLTLIAFGFYLSLSFFLGPKFLLSDLREKFHALADDIIAVTARVLDPPVQPVVTATPVCVTGAPRVNLDWADDNNSVSWDIDRDGLPLVTGLTASSYSDATVTNTTAYSYVVTARGPMGPGFAVADPAVATTLDCPVIQPTPVLGIVTFHGMNIASSGILKTIAVRPIFTGTTNIPNATVDILVNSTQIISDQITANGAGYWSWTPAIDLEVGDHTVTVTATDPLDGTRSVIGTAAFVIEVEPSSESSSGGSDKKKRQDAKIFIQPVIKNQLGIPFDFSLDGVAPQTYQGDALTASLGILRVDPKYVGSEVNIFSDIVGPDGQDISSVESIWVLVPHATIDIRIPVPLAAEPGDRYRIRTTLTIGQYAVTKERIFTVLSLPILSFGGGTVATLPQIVAFSGWIALSLATLLFSWLFLFLREYWLYLHSWRHITERQLIRLGFFGTRRGVST